MPPILSLLGYPKPPVQHISTNDITGTENRQWKQGRNDTVIYYSKLLYMKIH